MCVGCLSVNTHASGYCVHASCSCCSYKQYCGGEKQTRVCMTGNARAIIAVLACERCTEDCKKIEKICTMPALKKLVYIMKFTSVRDIRFVSVHRVPTAQFP